MIEAVVSFAAAAAVVAGVVADSNLSCIPLFVVLVLKPR